MTTVIVSGPGIDGPFVVVEQHDDGTLVLRPAGEGRTLEDVQRELGSESITVAEFEAEYGRTLPPDGEG